MFLTLKNIDKEFSKGNGVNNISLYINEGELVTLLGPSGCGKTTTLNMIPPTPSFTNIKNNPSIRDRDSYIHASLDQWFEDWTLRYQELSEDQEK